MKRLLVMAALLVVVAIPALPAMGGNISGGCTVTATSTSDSTDVFDATQADPFVIDPSGTISWDGSSLVPITNHHWEVGVVVLGTDVQLFSGSSENSGLSQESSGSKSIPAELDRIGNSQISWILSNFGGVIEVYGSIDGDGGSCSGSGFVLLDLGPLEGIVGQVSLATAAAGLALMALAGVGKVV